MSEVEVEKKRDRDRVREKLASKQTNRNASGSPIVINDHLVIVISYHQLRRERSVPCYFDAVENREGIAYARDFNERVHINNEA